MINIRLILLSKGFLMHYFLYSFSFSDPSAVPRSAAERKGSGNRPGNHPNFYEPRG